MKHELESVLEALHVWLHIYAPEFCDQEQVLSARDKLWEAGGTIAYITANIQTVRSLLQMHNGEGIAPGSFEIEVIYSQDGGFAPIRASGIRLKHFSGVIVECSKHHSQHRNKMEALSMLYLKLAEQVQEGK